jgi:folate-binding protein YgfZ
MLPAAHARAVLEGAVMAEPGVAVLDVAGPGSVACLQGLLTNDLEKPGDGSYLYAALLTPKGMLVTDLWLARVATVLSLRVPAAGAAPLLEVFQRSLPPRLAKVADEREERTVLRIAGPLAIDAATRAGLAVPPEGRVCDLALGGVTAGVARPAGPSPFALEITASPAHLPAVRARLEEAGVVPTTPAALDLARILTGWPVLGAEINERTLPQEVRLDELGGVSYTKGCYVGQETVARLHFRGHANRQLRGLVWDSAPDPTQSGIEQDGTPRGRVTSLAWDPTLERWIGLGILRRETDLEHPVTACGGSAGVLMLPFPA